MGDLDDESVPDAVPNKVSIVPNMLGSIQVDMGVIRAELGNSSTLHTVSCSTSQPPFDTVDGTLPYTLRPRVLLGRTYDYRKCWCPTR